MIRILLVDDQALLCEVLKTWLEVEEDFQVVGVAHEGEEALGKVELLQPDIVLMDIDMPGMDGLKATNIISQRFPKVKVIFLSAYDDATYLSKSLRVGAKAYLLKNTTAEELAKKIRFVYQDKQQMSDEETKTIQTRLEELFKTYRHKFQQQLEQAKAALAELTAEPASEDFSHRLRELETLADKYERRLVELETLYQAGWESMRIEIINIQKQFGEANRSLGSQINQQIVNLKRELDAQLSDALEDWSRQRAALQEWAVERDEMRPSHAEIESKYRHEIMTAVNPVRASLRNVNKQMQMMRNGLIVSIVIAAMALTFAGILFSTNINSNDNSKSFNESTGEIEIEN